MFELPKISSGNLEDSVTLLRSLQFLLGILSLPALRRCCLTALPSTSLIPVRSVPDSLTRLLDADCAGLWPDMGEPSGPEPGRDCSDQGRISFQLQSGRIFRHPDIHVACPNMTHRSEIGDKFDI